ncbi:hypothetical protein AMP2_gp043 [Pseudomonas phage vB_Pae_AM.P2]|uniref:Uncharacterized protein n=1 Tax=Pseudomonas phage vB_Pae_AM.P2 TaxID=2731695 RepID=A0A7S5W9H6_9CAUD|nr:hypothetical protein AMP2_gp043 [Pseudomonas phage vB_Pae_AM.P2]
MTDTSESLNEHILLLACRYMYSIKREAKYLKENLLIEYRVVPSGLSDNVGLYKGVLWADACTNLKV